MDFLRKLLLAGLSVLSSLAYAENSVGIGQLLPGRYLGAVRAGSEDKLPQISNDVYSKGQPLPQALAVRPVAIPNLAPTGSVPKMQAAVVSEIASNEPDSAELVTPQNGSVPQMVPQKGAAKFIAGSVGDAPDTYGVTGLGAGYGRGEKARAQASEFSEQNGDTFQNLNNRYTGLSPDSSAQTAASRLLASVQVKESTGPSTAEAVQQVDESLKSDTYRALTSVLAFQEMPRGSAGQAKPKSYWTNPDPDRKIRSSEQALTTAHSKDVMGQATSAFRRSPAESGPVPSQGDSGGIGQAGGIYSGGSSGGAGAQAAQATAAPFQPMFPFPLPSAAQNAQE